MIIAEIPGTIKVVMPLILGASLSAQGVDSGMEVWLRNLAFLVGLAVGMKHLLGKKQSQPQPFKIQELKEMATHDDLNKLEQHVEAKFETGRNLSRVALGHVHERIDQVAKTAAASDAKLGEVKDNIDRLLNKLL
tara:strand:- start:398 stop:802 length:405 start_codon:yes stop_codon:yes gene_type:complete